MINSFQIYLPAKNEEIDLKNTILSIKDITADKIIVVDNNSTDKTNEIAKKYSDLVIFEKDSGKGNVIKKILNETNSEFIFFTDADNTYDITKYEEHKKMIISNDLDMIVGKRIYDKKFLKRLDRKIANKLFNIIFKFLIGGKFNDICSGYRILRVSKFRDLNVQSKNFEIETEINIFAIKNNLKVSEFEIGYKERVKSLSKLKTFSDSSKIVYFLLKQSIITFPYRFLVIFFIILALVAIINVINW